MSKKLNLNAIRIDGGTQVRVSLNEGVVADYMDCLDALPPVVVFFDGSDHWLADGFHRYHAHKQSKKASIPADIRTGTRREAVLFSFGANRGHGLRMSNADKRAAVTAMLADSEWGEWSDRKIADECGVTHPFVASIRRPPEVVTVTTPEPKAPTAQAAKSSAPAPKTESPKSAKPEPEVPALTGADELNEAQHTITELAQENEVLRDRLAVEAMDASEHEKTAASETIRELRMLVKTLEAEAEALKVSRDTYMREAGEAKKQVNYWRKQAEKAAKDAA